MPQNRFASNHDAPQNGLAGLQHWRYDLIAGLQVALVSLPLSLGIAIASGAPPVTGLISAIIAGLVYPFLGGSFVTISGPAAGLAPALLAGMLSLGDGDLAAGYPLLLVAICLTGAVQIALTFFKVGEFARIIPIPVVEGMLASIGLIIIIKQVPLLVGDLTPPDKSIPLAVLNLPGSVGSAVLEIAVIGAISLGLMFALSHSKARWVRILPPPLLVVGFGIVAQHVLQIDRQFLIKMPDSIFSEGLTLPDFARVINEPSLWPRILTVVITLTVIDGIESLATVAAVDKIDPFQRRSDPNKTLRAMGVSNVLSSIAGGLTIIPGGIKSRANVDAGARTLWANAYNALFLIIFLWVGKDLINRIPLATLAAILIYVGWRLCEPQIWFKVLAVGKEQLLLFVFTVASVLMVDLLFGIIAGVAAKAVLLVYLQTPPLRYVLIGEISLRQLPRIIWGHVRGLFNTPVRRLRILEQDGYETHSLYLSSSTSFNLFKLEKSLAEVPPTANVNLVMTLSARIVDHTTMEHLHHFQEQCVRDGRRCEIRGMEIFHRFSDHPLSGGLHDGRLRKEKEQLTVRQQALSEWARQFNWTFSPAIVSPLNEHNFSYLSRGSDKEVRNVIKGTHKNTTIEIFDYSYTDLRQYFLDTRHTMILINVRNSPVPVPDCLLEPEGHIVGHRIHGRDIHLEAGLHFPHRYHLHGYDEESIRHFFTADLIRFFDTHPQFYMEIRNHHVLAFRVDHDLERIGAIPLLLSFADAIIHACAPRVGLTA